MLLARLLGFLFLIYPISSGDTEKHDFHTSLTEMRYNEGSKAFEITIRVFTDDLDEMVKANESGKAISLDNSDKVIDTYIKKNFAFIRGKEVLFGNFLGKESEDDVTWLYLELENGDSLKGFSILNTIFLDYFDDQKNLLNVLFKKERTTLIFSEDNRLQAFPF
mgnify:CR=1 FL=1